MKERLGDVLRQKREELKLSLRQVQDKTGISNAYLSQLENHKITQPSPSILGKLAELYGVSYGRLMRLTGYPVVPSQVKSEILFRTSSGLEEISPEEEKELMEYLRFLRMRRLEK